MFTFHKTILLLHLSSIFAFSVVVITGMTFGDIEPRFQLIMFSCLQIAWRPVPLKFTNDAIIRNSAPSPKCLFI